jgi:hypothetical protein
MFALRTFPLDEVVPGAEQLPGDPPAMADIVVVDGARYRVLEVQHRYGDAFRGERLVEHVALVESQAQLDARAAAIAGTRRSGRARS